MSTPLSTIVAIAAAGAPEEAWRLFQASGFAEGRVGSTEAILRGRLLKAVASRATGMRRAGLFRQAAESYALAGTASEASYPLINAATLSLLAGDPTQAAAYARDVLASLEAHPDEPETPYWRAATRAEALLLLDREADARAAFAEAIAIAPRAWEDHASTLRQFALILAEQGRDASWLDAHRPPRSVHFGGHMSFDAGRARRAHLDESIAGILDEEKVYFGYGALAAGADIIVAEALVARGAELHAVLPGGPEAFASVSVDPFGKGWRRRYDALLARAETVRTVRPAATPPDAEMVALGDEVAMGAAAINARRLESEAIRLVVAPGDGRGAPGGPWRERRVAAPRETAAAPPLTPAPHARHALLALAMPAGPDLEARLAAAALRIAAVAPPRLAPWFTGREILLAYAAPAEAAGAALALAADEEAVGGHYGIADPVADPFANAPRIAGDPAALAAGAAASAPPGAVCVTADFAAALAAAGNPDLRTELVGELAGAPGEDPVELHAVARAAA
jgi:hypothetical protein